MFSFNHLFHGCAWLLLSVDVPMRGGNLRPVQTLNLRPGPVTWPGRLWPWESALVVESPGRPCLTGALASVLGALHILSPTWVISLVILRDFACSYSIPGSEVDSYQSAPDFESACILKAVPVVSRLYNQHLYSLRYQCHISRC